MDGRYYTWFGSNPEIKADVHMAGPQDGSQILDEIKALLARPGVKKVAVVGDYGTGERIEITEQMKEPPR